MRSLDATTQSPEHVFHQQGGVKPTSSYCLNWEKVILFSNTALIVTGIAIAFFLKLPLVMIGLGAYGIAYLLIHTLARKQEGANVIEKRKEVAELDEKLKEYRETRDRIRKEVADLRAQRVPLSREQENRNKAIQYDEVCRFLKAERERGGSREIGVFVQQVNQVMKGALRRASAES